MLKLCQQQCECQGCVLPKQLRQQAEIPRARHLCWAGPKRWGQKQEHLTPNFLQLPPQRHCPFVEGGVVSKAFMMRLKTKFYNPWVSGQKRGNMIRVYLQATFPLPQTNSAILLKSGNSFSIKTPFVMNLQSLKCYPTLLTKLQDKASLILPLSSRLYQHFLSDFPELYSGQIIWPKRPKLKSSTSNLKKNHKEVVKQLQQHFWWYGTGLRKLIVPAMMALHMKSRITVKLIVSWENLATNYFSLSLRLPTLCQLTNL